MRTVLNPGIVCGVAEDRRRAEVMVRIGSEQWLVAEVPFETAPFWKQRIGQLVLVDATSQPPLLHARQGY